MPVNPSRIAATPRKPVSADDDTNEPQDRAESREPDLCNCGADSLEILLPLVKALRQRVEALEKRNAKADDAARQEKQNASEYGELRRALGLR
jgi:hypothetical protein